MIASFRVGTRAAMVVHRRDVIESLRSDDARRVAREVVEQIGVRAAAAAVGIVADSDDDAARVEQVLAKALESGTMVLVSERTSRRLDGPKSMPLSDLIVPTEPVVPVEPGRALAVRVVDAYGNPIPGANLVLEHSGGRETAATADDGWLRFEDVRWTNVEASLEVGDALRQHVVRAMQSAPGRAPLTRDDGVEVVYLRSRTLGPVRVPAGREVTISVQPFVVLGRMTGMHFGTDRDLPLAASMAMLPEVRSVYGRCRPCKVLVVGHTDTSGTPAHNEALSLRRAEVVRALLIGDVDDWLGRFESGWGKAEVESLIDALIDAGQRPLVQRRVEWFQSTRGLVVDGDAGPATREALVRELMNRGGVRLPGTPDVVAHGCGEAFPLDATGVELDEAPVDGADDPMDRRVEVFFFGSVLGIEPPPPGPTSGEGSMEYPAWRSSAGEIHEWVLGAEALELLLRDAEGQPMAGARYRVTLPAGLTIEGELDGDGFARLERLPAGECRVELLDFAEGCEVVREVGV